MHIFPYCKKVAANISDAEFAYTTLDQTTSGPILRGYTVLPGDKPLPTAQTWSKIFAPGDIVSSSPATYSAIASFGRVTGDKSTLYKYLNPHLHVVASITPSLSQGRIMVVDIISGRAVYDVVVPDLMIRKGIIADMVENWLVYRWLDRSGWKLASVDLYEDRSTGVTSVIEKGRILQKKSCALTQRTDLASRAMRRTSKSKLSRRRSLWVRRSGD